MSIDAAYELLYNIVLILFLCLIGAALIRSVIGPRVTDRILCINMIGTMVISCIVLLSRKLQESYLCDVALIYAMLSFLAVLMMATLYIPSQTRRKRFLEPGKNRENKSEKKMTETDPMLQKENVTERPVKNSGRTQKITGDRKAGRKKLTKDRNPEMGKQEGKE